MQFLTNLMVVYPEFLIRSRLKKRSILVITLLTLLPLLVVIYS